MTENNIPHVEVINVRCCCINEPVIVSHCVHLQLGHRFHALLKVRSDRDDNVPLKGRYNSGYYQINKLFSIFFI